MQPTYRTLIYRRFGSFSLLLVFGGESIAAVSPVDSQFVRRGLQHDSLRTIRRYVPVKHKDTGKFELVLISELEEMKRNGLIVSERGGDVFVDPK